jgi:cell wall assembly regulator SMI1
MNDAAEIWANLERVLAARDDIERAQLLPPASAEEIARTESTIGARFAPALAASLAIHEGQGDGAAEVMGEWRLYALAEMVRVWRRFESMREEGSIEWDARWIPIAADGNGNHLIIDLATGRIAEVARVIEHPKTLAPDFVAWLGSIAREIEASDDV